MYVCECEVLVRANVRVLRLEGDEKNQGQPPVSSLTLLGSTGILIRAAEYHCFIPQRSRTHTHSHIFSHMRAKYTEGGGGTNHSEGRMNTVYTERKKKKRKKNPCLYFIKI